MVYIAIFKYLQLSVACNVGNDDNRYKCIPLI